MKDQAPIRPGFALAIVAVTGVIITGAILFSRTAQHAQPPSEPPMPEVAASSQKPVAIPEDAPVTAAPVANGQRPETALLEGLPEVKAIREPNSPLSDLKVSFKLDPRLTQSLYMGDRWLAPARHLQVGAGKTCTIEASIRGLNAQGKAVKTPATWRVADPEMVKISPPGPGNTVKLTVLRPGETTVEIASQGITKRLPLHATRYGTTLMVALAQ